MGGPLLVSPNFFCGFDDPDRICLAREKAVAVANPLQAARERVGDALSQRAARFQLYLALRLAGS
jgi:hypothetical protein